MLFFTFSFGNRVQSNLYLSFRAALFAHDTRQTPDTLQEVSLKAWDVGLGTEDWISEPLTSIHNSCTKYKEKNNERQSIYSDCVMIVNGLR